jgi:phage terminase large subunit-like protein
MRRYTEIATSYARGVQKGEILACKWVRLACRRHLDDLKKSRRKTYPFRFDDHASERVCFFLELLPHTKGKWAKGIPGDPDSKRFRLEPWQVFIVCVLFGWLNKQTGLRRFRKAYICIPRKNGKSQLAAGIGLYMFAADGEHGAEVYSGATTEKQAWEVFRPARAMAASTPGLRNHFGVDVHAKNLHVAANGSRFEPVIGKPGDGSSPNCAIIDEYHEHASDEQVETMATGMGAREQPILFMITTAGSDVAGPCYAQQQDLQKVLEGVVEDDELFGIIYTIDEGDDWTSEEALRKANPNYGVSTFEDYLRSEQLEAIRSSRKQNVFKTKHLNLWVQARTAWMNLQAWNRLADPELRPEQFLRESCWAGLDLSSKVDLSAAVKCFKREIDGEDHYYFFGRYYVPEERTEAPDRRHYQGWILDGALIATDGAVIDHARIRDDLVDDSEQFQLEEVGFDPYGATQLITELQDEYGITTVEIPQRVSHLSDPMKWVEAMVLAGRLHHDGNPVLTWAMSNVTARVDANDNVFPRKERPEAMIDPAVALIMAMARAMVGASSAQPSITIW